MRTLPARDTALERDGIADLQAWACLGGVGPHRDDLTRSLVAEAEGLADLDTAIAKMGVVVYVGAADGGGTYGNANLIARKKQRALLIRASELWPLKILAAALLGREDCTSRHHELYGLCDRGKIWGGTHEATIGKRDALMAVDSLAL